MPDCRHPYAIVFFKFISCFIKNFENYITVLSFLKSFFEFLKNKKNILIKKFQGRIIAKKLIFFSLKPFSFNGTGHRNADPTISKFGTMLTVPLFQLAKEKFI